MDHMAQTVAMTQQLSMPQLQQQSSERFRVLGQKESDTWASFAALHIGAKIAAQGNRRQVAPPGLLFSSELVHLMASVE
jgi:hypothetical protein